MYHLRLSLLLLGASFVPGLAQSGQLLQKGVSHFEAFELDSAALKISRAIELAEEDVDWINWGKGWVQLAAVEVKHTQPQWLFDTLTKLLPLAQQRLAGHPNILGDYYYRITDAAIRCYDPKSAWSAYEEMQALYALGYPDNDLKQGLLYETKGRILMLEGRFPEALEPIQRSLDKRKLHPQTTYWHARSLAFLGENYLRMERLDDAFDYINRASSILEGDPAPRSRDLLSRVSSNLGIVYKWLDNHKKALYYSEKALGINLALFGENHFQISGNYLNLGSEYFRYGAYTMGTFYTEKALESARTTVGMNSVAAANALTNLASVYQVKGAFEKAVDYYQQALAIFADLYGEDHPNVVAPYYRLGDALAYTEDIAEAKVCLDKAYALSVKYYGEESPSTGYIHGCIGSLYGQAIDGKPVLSEEQAFYHLNRNIEITKKTMGEYNYSTALAYFFKGDALMKAGDWKEALYNFKEARRTNTYPGNQNFPGHLHDYYNPVLFLGNENCIAETYLSIYRAKEDIQQLRNALGTIDHLDKKLDEITQMDLELGDLITINRVLSSEMIKTGIEASYLLYQETGDLAHLEKAFYYAERGKGQSLLHHLHSIDALKFAGIADSLLTTEKTLKKEVTKLRVDLLQARRMGDEQNAQKIYNLWFSKQEAYSKLLDRIERRHPEYYQLKYDYRIPAVEDIQKQLLAPEQALVSFYKGDSVVFVFTLTRERLDVRRIADGKAIDNLLDSMRSSITQVQHVNNRQNFQRFTEKAYTAYLYLLAPSLAALPPSINRLTIVPDGQLGYLPFEILLTQPHTGQAKSSYKTLPYLIREYPISYAYSSALLRQEKTSPIGFRGLAYGGFAPVYADTMPAPELSDIGVPGEGRNLIFMALRDGLNDLPAARKSVAAVARRLGGDAFLKEKATEATFKNQAHRYQVIHLAMHGLLDDENPMYSKLVFTQLPDDTEDNYLNAVELFNMELNAELTVLGACNTAYGEIHRGEGIMSLSRAFAFAGCPSMLASLWSIPDDATAQIIQHFFEGLQRGLPKDRALQQAKLSYLADRPERLASPFFWAGFVQIGDRKPIELPRPWYRSPWLAIGIGLALVGIIGLVALLRYRPNLRVI